MSLIDWILATERAVGHGSGSFTDVINRPLREVMTASGQDPDASFPGFSLVGHTHDASAIASGTLAPARGGTGLSSPQAGALLIAAGALAMTVLAAPAAGQVVRSSGTAWTAAPIAAADVSDLGTASTGITKVGTLVAGAIGAGFTPIIDTFLATIGTPGKVANAATTAAAANTPSAIVARDASGNFSAGTITASFTGALTGVASLATQLVTPRAINGVNFDGSAPITVKASTTNALTFGTHLTGTSFDGSAAVTIATDATAANTPSTIVSRDPSGNFIANIITAALSGNASTATVLATPRAINGVNFDGSAAITIKASTTNALTLGAHLTGAVSFDGSAAVTLGTDAASANTPSTIVARDAAGNFSAGTITATLAGSATTAATVTTAAQPTITSLGTLTALTVAGVTTGSGGFTSAKGALATATGVFATMFTPAVAGRYSVAWTLEGFGSSSIYSGVAEIVFDGTSAYLLSLVVGSTTAAQLSGNAFQIKQSSGTPQTMNWSYVFIPF